VNSFADRPDAVLSGLLRRVIDIAAQWDTTIKWYKIGSQEAGQLRGLPAATA
jgi:hypothetical protein